MIAGRAISACQIQDIRYDHTTPPPPPPPPPPCTTPSAPTGVSASDGNYTDKVRVTWNSVTDATGYEVWRNSSNSSSSASKLGNSTTSPFDDSNATSGTTYYYWVIARNDCGASGFSSSDSGYITCVALSAPTGVSASNGTYTDKVRVTWNLVSGAAAYEVWRNTSNSSGSASKLSDSNTSPFDDSSVTAGTTYYYWVKAKNTCGTSDFSSSDSGYASTTPKTMSIAKCTVTAGSKDNSDTISLSGTMNATADDFSGDNVVVTVNSSDMVSPLVETFPIAGNFKGGKFNGSTSNASFALDTKTTKFSFTAKNVDLSGLSCPLTVQIKIGDYDVTVEVGETIVNGGKPIPINLLMGVQNSLRVDSSKFTRNKKTGRITQVTVSGGFSLKDTIDMTTNPFSVSVGTQTFILPAKTFKNVKGKFTCSNVKLTGGIVAATFDSNKCTFTLTIKGTKITDPKALRIFEMEFGHLSESADVSLP